MINTSFLNNGYNRVLGFSQDIYSGVKNKLSQVTPGQKATVALTATLAATAFFLLRNNMDSNPLPNETLSDFYGYNVTAGYYEGDGVNECPDPRILPQNLFCEAPTTSLSNLFEYTVSPGEYETAPVSNTFVPRVNENIFGRNNLFVEGLANGQGNLYQNIATSASAAMEIAKEWGSAIANEIRSQGEKGARYAKETITMENMQKLFRSVIDSLTGKNQAIQKAVIQKYKLYN